jgi:hypothetical protein
VERVDVAPNHRRLNNWHRAGASSPTQRTDHHPQTSPPKSQGSAGLDNQNMRAKSVLGLVPMYRLPPSKDTSTNGPIKSTRTPPQPPEHGQSGPNKTQNPNFPMKTLTTQTSFPDPPYISPRKHLKAKITRVDEEEESRHKDKSQTRQNVETHVPLFRSRRGPHNPPSQKGKQKRIKNQGGKRKNHMNESLITNNIHHQKRDKLQQKTRNKKQRDERTQNVHDP